MLGETRCRGLGLALGQLRSPCVHRDGDGGGRQGGDGEGTAIVLRLIWQHKGAAQPAVRPFPRVNGCGAGAGEPEGVLGAGPPCRHFTVLTQICPTSAACLHGARRLCLLRPLPVLQLSPGPPAPHPSAPPADASTGPRGRWQHLVAERSPAAGLYRALVTGPPGSPLPARPGLGTHPQPQSAWGRVCSEAPQGGHAAHATWCLDGGRAWGDWQPARAGVRPQAQPRQEPSPNICFQLRAVGMVFLGRGRLLLHC